MKFTYEVNLSNFLDTKLINKSGSYITKLAVHWFSQIPRRFKRNVANGELNRVVRISSHFNKEKTLIKQKFDDAGYVNETDDIIIPSYLFEVKKLFILLELPYCEENENKHFLKNLCMTF